jgi:hypothetical protein
VNINWPNDHKVGCKSSFNLINFIGIYANLEEELEEFKRTFDRNEIVDI